MKVVVTAALGFSLLVVGTSSPNSACSPQVRCRDMGVHSLFRVTEDAPLVAERISWTKVKSLDDLKTIRDDRGLRRGVILDDPSAELYGGVAKLERISGLDLIVSSDAFLDGVESIGTLTELSNIKLTVADIVTQESALWNILPSWTKTVRFNLVNLQVDGDIVKALSGMKKLTHVTMAIGGSLSPSVVESLRSARLDTFVLFLDGFQGDSSSLLGSIGGLRSLTHLSLRGLPAAISSAAFQKLRPAEQLSSLEIVGFPGYDRHFIAGLSSLPGLQELKIRGVRFDESMFSGLAEMRSLESLTLGEIEGEATPAQMKAALSAVRVPRLTLLGLGRTCSMHEWIGTLGSVVDLTIGGERSLDRETLAEVGRLPLLSTLSLGVNELSIGKLRTLLEVSGPKLKELDLSASPVEFDKDELSALRRAYPKVSIRTAFED